MIVLVCAGVGLRHVHAEELVSTAEHRFWVTSRDADGDGELGEWVEAKELKPGDRFLLSDGSEATLCATESTHRDVEPDVLHPKLQPSTFNPQPITTYNFEVANTHTYFVGDIGIWVHNAGSAPCSRRDWYVRIRRVYERYVLGVRYPKYRVKASVVPVRGWRGFVHTKLLRRRQNSDIQRVLNFFEESTTADDLLDDVLRGKLKVDFVREHGTGDMVRVRPNVMRVVIERAGESTGFKAKGIATRLMHELAIRRWQHSVAPVYPRGLPVTFVERQKQTSALVELVKMHAEADIDHKIVHAFWQNGSVGLQKFVRINRDWDDWYEWNGANGID